MLLTAKGAWPNVTRIEKAAIAESTARSASVDYQLTNATDGDSNGFAFHIKNH